jgi:CarD family transcriptional regulator
MPTQDSVTVGDQVVHPHHGQGVVTATDTVDLGAGAVPYVTIAIDGGLTLKVPVDSLADVGIREPVSAERAEEVLAVLSQPAQEDPGHRVRRRRDSEKLASGKLIECAEVVRDLHAIIAAHEKGGNHADKQMLASARDQLAAELAVVLEATEEDAKARIDEALARGVDADTSAKASAST